MVSKGVFAKHQNILSELNDERGGLRLGGEWWGDLRVDTVVGEGREGGVGGDVGGVRGGEMSGC